MLIFELALSFGVPRDYFCPSIYLFQHGNVGGTSVASVAGFVAFLFCCCRCSGSFTAGKSDVGRCGVHKPGRARPGHVDAAPHSPRPPCTRPRR